jgi:hypothetical protein
MLDTAKVRVCSIVNTEVAGSLLGRSTALPLRMAPEEKLLEIDRSEKTDRCMTRIFRRKRAVRKPKSRSVRTSQGEVSKPAP